MKQSERSFQFKKNYVEMRDRGMSVYEISDYYHLSCRHAYNLIRELADEIGVPYESLLNRPHCTHIVIGSAKVQPVKRVDFSSFEKEFREGISMFDKTLNQMDRRLKEWPVMPEALMNLKEVANER